MFAKGLTSAALAVLSFLAVCSGIRSLLPFPPIEPIASKLEFFQRHRDQIDTVFLGSSRIYHQFSPAVFDRTMGAAGFPTRSFNLGMDGMFLAEESYVLEQLLKHENGKLRWVFIELEALSPSFDPNNAGTERLAYWHDWTRTRAIFRPLFKVDLRGKAKDPWDVVTGLKAKKKERHDLFVLHLSLFARTFLNLGAARNLHFARATEASSALASYASDEGYRPAQRHLKPEKVAAYERALHASDPATDHLPIDGATEDLCRRCAEIVRQHGATPIFVVTPITPQVQQFFETKSAAPGALFFFNDFRTYPQLYRPEVRVDGSHLTAAGAEIFSKLLAQKFAAGLKNGEIN